MNKKKLLISLSLTGVLLIVALVMMISSQNNKFDYKNKSTMFENINDLSFLNEDIVEESINLDEDISDDCESSLSEKRTVLLEYNGNRIYVFAYVFDTVDSCLEYANKVSGNNYKRNYEGNDIARYYYKHTSFFNIFQTEKVLVFQNNQAYVISAKIPEKDFNEFVEYYMSQLPNKVEMLY